VSLHATPAPVGPADPTSARARAANRARAVSGRRHMVDPTVSKVPDAVRQLDHRVPGREPAQ